MQKNKCAGNYRRTAQFHSLASQIDFHVHTAYSGEEQSEGFTIPRMCELADKKGIKYVLYTEHWKRPEQVKLFKQIREEIEECKKKHEVKVLLSAEISIINSKGETAIDLKLAKGILDIVSASPHHYYDGVTKQLLPDILEDARDMVIKIAENKYVDLILHPQIINNVLDARPIPNGYYQQMMKAVKENGKVVECTSVQMLKAVTQSMVEGRAPKWWQNLAKEHFGTAINKGWGWWSKKIIQDYSNFIQAVVENGVKFVIGTDAHNERLPDCFGNHPWFGETQETVTLLEQYGVDEKNLWIPHLHLERNWK